MRYTITILTFFLFPSLNYGQGNSVYAPDFSVRTTDGDSLRLYTDVLDIGKTVVLELFWEGCPPCNTFAPFMGDLYQEWGNGTEDVVFIALDVLPNETDADVKTFQTDGKNIYTFSNNTIQIYTIRLLEESAIDLKSSITAENVLISPRSIYYIYKDGVDREFRK